MLLHNFKVLDIERSHSGSSLLDLLGRENMSIDFLLNADSSTSSALKAVLASYALYLVSQVVYRLYLSPLAKFPGSRLAAATGWYETYYQLVKGGGGQFTFKIAEWHKKYGTLACSLPAPNINCS